MLLSILGLGHKISDKLEESMCPYSNATLHLGENFPAAVHSGNAPVLSMPHLRARQKQVFEASEYSELISVLL